MQMKYFQPLADIRNHYDDIEKQLNNERFGKRMLESWNIDKDDEQQVAQIRREHEALRYLTSLQLMLVHGRDALKPDMADLKSAFERHLAHIDETFDCRADNWRTCEFKNIRKQYEACRHYLFKLSLPAWVDKLPDRVLTFENKYPDFNKKVDRH